MPPSAASAMSLQRALTKGFFKDFDPILDFDTVAQVRGVEFSMNGLSLFVCSATKLMKYEQKVHGKTEKLEKSKEIALSGIQSMKPTESGDLAIVTFDDGKNVLCFYSSALEKLSAFEIRGSGNIDKCKRSHPLTF